MMRNGLLSALWRGFVPHELFPGASVRFFSDGHWIRGKVVQHTGRHRTGKARPTRIEVTQPVEPGSVGMWDFPDPRMRGTRLYARGHDDVTGVAAIVSLLDTACRRKDQAEFYAFFTRAEESGFLGAIGASRDATLPRRCRIIALETSKALSNARLGDGVIIRVGDRMTVFEPALTQAIADAAKDLKERRKGFKYQRRLMDGGTCESSVYGAYGYRAAGLCLALGNYHNVNWDKMKLGPEYVDVNDYLGMVHLLRTLVVSGFPAEGQRVRTMCEDLFREHGEELTASAGT